MAVNSDVELCNLALGHMGDFGTIESIDTPESAAELIFAKWYDVSRQTYLKKVMPNFAMSRENVAENATNNQSEYFNSSYPFPSNALKILGIGEVKNKMNDYTVEENTIYTSQTYDNGLPVRFIKDITDISKWSPEAKIGFSWYLAAQTCMEVTQDKQILQLMEQKSRDEMANVSGLNAQENRPIRISRSLNRDARAVGFPKHPDKK